MPAAAARAVLDRSLQAATPVSGHGPLIAFAVALVLIAIGVIVAAILARVGLRAYGEAADRERQLRIAADEARDRAEELAEQQRRQADELQRHSEEARTLALELRRSNEQLERSRNDVEAARQRLAAVLDALPDAATAYDAEWRITYVNPAGEALIRRLGDDPGRVMGRVLWETYPRALRSGFERDARRAVAERRVVEHVSFFEALDIWLEHRVVPLAEGAVTYSRDVTERLRAAETQARLAAIVEASDDAIMSKDLDGTIRSWNEGAARLFGWTAEEAVGRPITILFPPGLEAEEERILERLRRGETIDHYETVRIRRDGTPIYVSLSISPIRDHLGTPVSAAKIARDISARRNVEEALRAEALALETLQRIGSAVTAELDLGRLVQLVTDEATAITGAEIGALFYDRAEGNTGYRQYVLSGAPRARFAHATDPGPDGLFGHTFRGDVVIRSDDITTDFRYRQPPPPALPTDHPPVRSYLAVPIISRSGAVLGGLFLGHPECARFSERHERIASGIAAWAAVAMDNARLYQAERAARAEAQEASRAKSDFLATMSHELRTPLNAIAGYAELLAMGVRGTVTEEQRDYLERIQRAQRLLLSLINDVLNLSRLEAGHLHVDLQEVPVREILLGLEALVGPQLRARALHFACEGCDAAARVRGDVEKARQVLLNLLSNAAKFTEPGGRVVVRTVPHDAVVDVQVRDTGPGIPPDKLEHIFEPFVQLNRGLTSSHEGTGLGLAISRDLARAMGGELTVESELGEGSVFTLTLPRVRTRASECAPARAPS